MDVDAVSVEMNKAPFKSRYSNEQECIDAVMAMKWPNGFVCPRCANTECNRLNSRRIPLFECKDCGHQTSVLVGTLFERTHLPLLKWFEALHWFLLPNGISASKLSRIIQVTYKTAWLMLHKIRHAVKEFDAQKLLSGEVKVNCDQYGQNPSRYSRVQPHASAVIAGCTVTESGAPQHVKIDFISNQRGNHIRANRQHMQAFIERHVDVANSDVRSFHQAFKLYVPLRRLIRQAWRSLTKTYVALGRKHLPSYLNEYTGRYRLFQHGEEQGGAKKETMQQKLLRMCIAIPPLTYRKLIAPPPDPPLADAA